MRPDLMGHVPSCTQSPPLNALPSNFALFKWLPLCPTQGGLGVLAGADEANEEEFEIDLNDDEPAFLAGHSSKSGAEMSPVKIVKNPEGSLQRAAMTQVQCVCIWGECACFLGGGVSVGEGVSWRHRGRREGEMSALLQYIPPSCSAPTPGLHTTVSLQPHLPMTSPPLMAQIEFAHSFEFKQSALAKERRELQMQQQRTLLEAIPRDLSRPWEDPMPEEGGCSGFRGERVCAAFRGVCLF